MHMHLYQHVLHVLNLSARKAVRPGWSDCDTDGCNPAAWQNSRQYDTHADVKLGVHAVTQLGCKLSTQYARTIKYSTGLRTTHGHQMYLKVNNVHLISSVCLL